MARKFLDGRSIVTNLKPEERPEGAHEAVEKAYFATRAGEPRPDLLSDFTEGRLDFSTLPDTAEAIPYLIAQAMVVRTRYAEGSCGPIQRREFLLAARMAVEAAETLLTESTDTEPDASTVMAVLTTQVSAEQLTGRIPYSRATGPIQ